MSYGGISIMEIDAEFGFFYVQRDAGYWNRYSIADEEKFLDWILDHREDIEVYELGDTE